jgi:hypothetical protein
MKNVNLKAKSISVWLASEGGLPMNSFSETVVNICDFHLAVLKGLWTVLFTWTIIAGMACIFIGAQFFLILDTYKSIVNFHAEPWIVFWFRTVGVEVIVATFDLWAIGLTVRYHYLKHFPKRIKKPVVKESGIIKQMYLSWRDKVCYNVTIGKHTE